MISQLIVVLSGKVGKDFLKILTEGAVKMEAGSLFHNPHRKCRPSSSVVARTLDNLEGVPS